MERGGGAAGLSPHREARRTCRDSSCRIIIVKWIINLTISNYTVEPDLKLIQLVFPGLVTRKRTTAGSIRYHYDGIAIKKNSSFYARFCCLLYEQNYLSSNSWSSENAADYKKNRQKKGTAEKETFQYLFPEFNQFFLGEQVQSETDPYEMIALLANDYYNYCQVILQMVRENKFDKELENILLPDFLEEVPAQHIDSIRLFSENVKCWMLNPLGGFPLMLQTSKSNEVKEFVKRLRRQTDLCNMAKTVRALLNNNSTVTVLRSGLHAVFNEQSLDVTKNLFRDKFRNPKRRQKNIQFKCLKNLISSLTSSTDIRDLLSGFSSDLQTFVIKPSRSKEAFKKQASDFMLKWNLLLSTVGKILTINRTDSFGSWLLLNLLLVDFAAHVFQTYIEEEKEDGNSLVAKQNDVPVLCVYEPSHLSACFAEDQPQASASQTALVMQNQNNFGLSNIFQSSELFGEHSHCQEGEINLKENYDKTPVINWVFDPDTDKGLIQVWCVVLLDLLKNQDNVHQLPVNWDLSVFSRLLKNHRERFCDDISQLFEDSWGNPIRFVGIQLEQQILYSFRVDWEFIILAVMVLQLYILYRT
ncbi:RFX family member 8, lacking RFX DNA binding protein [Pitangus sulphuratus]|nr:RFX family member 8, lacking RFX DNA binding protein [Pitangus sulphuratus]